MHASFFGWLCKSDTKKFILVWAKEGPSPAGGGECDYLAPKCLYRGEYK